ncbi:MAG: HSP20 family protein [Paraglaciecola sp.]|jgi:HSP20 family protein
MTLIRYNPNKFQPTTFNGFIDRFFNEEMVSGKSERTFSPQVDIAETENSFEIYLALPGFKKEDIHIDINADQLTVSGERKIKDEKQEKNFKSVETHYGTFSRSFYLPDNIDADKIDASYTDGILEVLVPKDEKKENKRLVNIK